MTRTPTPAEAARTQEIDDGLLMSALDMIGEPRGTTRTHRQLADYCNCSHTAIQEIERGALAKLKVRLGDVEGWQEAFSRHWTEGYRHEDARRDVLRACNRWLRKRGLCRRMRVERNELGMFMAA